MSSSCYEVHIYKRCKELWVQEDQCISITDKAYKIIIWSTDIMLNNFIDTPMYLLFQGIIKYVIEFNFALLARYYKKGNVQNNLYQIMNIMKALQCGFFCIEIISKSANPCLVGWIAEHHLGLSRCYVHIFYHVRVILESDAYGIDHYDIPMLN